MMPKQQSKVGLGFPRSLLLTAAVAEFGYRGVGTILQNSKVILGPDNVRIPDSNAMRHGKTRLQFSIRCIIAKCFSSVISKMTHFQTVFFLEVGTICLHRVLPLLPWQ